MTVPPEPTPAFPAARTGGAPPGRASAVAAEIVRLMRDELDFPDGPPSLEEPLAERLDSIQLLTLAVAVEDRFHVVLTDDVAASARSLSELARLVAERAPAERLPAGEASP